MELEGFEVDHQILISELDAKKSKDRNLKYKEITEVLEKVMNIIQSEGCPLPQIMNSKFSFWI